MWTIPNTSWQSIEEIMKKLKPDMADTRDQLSLNKFKANPRKFRVLASPYETRRITIMDL